MAFHKRDPVSDQTRARARELRRQMTIPEQRLWSMLRRKQLAGLRFAKQVPIGPFIADFVCREKRLIVEVDGDSHADRARQDADRSRWLTAQQFQIVRVANDDVLNDLEGVLATIVAAAGIDVEQWQSGALGQLPRLD